MMEAICLGFCSEHATSLRALNLLLWIQPDRNSLGRKKKKNKASSEGCFANPRNTFLLFKESPFYSL